MSDNKENFISLLNKYENNVVVPIIQRGYAQGRNTNEAEKIRDDFLDVIVDFLSNDKGELILDYIYGVKDNGIFYLLDGQQRLTTLFLFYWYFNFERERLKKFTYETRNSSKDFISFLLSIKRNEINLETNEKLSDKLKDNIKFLNFWEKDTTVKGMLKVIDDIHKRVKNNKNIKSSKLNGIQFYCEYIEGDPDDLYIKMNSRGKQLTDFEIFKSKLESFLDGKIDVNLLAEFKEKIDTTWSDFFWEFSKDSEKNDIDSIFKNFFDFVFRMLYAEQCEYIKKKNEKIGSYLKDFFNLFVIKTDTKYIDDSKNCMLECNIKFIVNILDIFYKLTTSKTIELFNEIFCIYDGNIYNNKISTFEENINIFDKKDDYVILLKINNYDLKYKILLFSFFIILNKIYKEENYKENENIDSIIKKIKDYKDILRFIRNFIFIYYEHIGNDDELKFQISFIKSFIENGKILLKPYNDNHQEILKIIVESEQNKLDILKSCDEKIRKIIYACENNVFLQGNIDFLLDNISNENIVNVVNYIFTKNGFNNENGNYLIHRAILVFIDKNEIENFRPYRSTTISIFRNNKDKDNDNKKLLIKYPNKLKEFINTIFNDKVNKTISDKCKNIIDNYKDDSHWKYLLIKNAKDANDNDVTLYNKEYSYSGEVKKHLYSGYYLYYQYRNSTHWDIPLTTKVHTMFYQLLKDNANFKDFKLYYYDGTNNPNIKGERILRYPNKEISYCYSWVTLAKEIEIENEKVLVGFTTAGYIIQCGLRKQKPFKNAEISEQVFELIKDKGLNFDGYNKDPNDDWYYMKDLDNYGEMLDEYKNTLIHVIDAFSKK
ncbi:DUF262 domain-containing protein [Brachyspira hampsonii]|uniref:DUF262 domain-containing protein n=1 Tax=Brachyspira hampsonii TaxID=1287055 RepID=UPI001C662695|nr:DUF262 domain-containing protein [Brachyspira hampsonii]